MGLKLTLFQNLKKRKSTKHTKRRKHELSSKVKLCFKWSKLGKTKIPNEIVCFSISVIVDYPHMLVVIQTILLCYLTECLSILAYAWYWYSHIVQVPHPAYARVDNWLSRLETIYQYYDQPGMPTNCGKVLFELSLQHIITFYYSKKLPPWGMGLPHM